ncbi:MAG: AarF/ABC1/UbiB kinase family protein, partial [Deltaproteobacteria bacterium]|nr:AarF/ABC1/UbiB kinase family protein [Deltaproteobacteria bacterium]
MTQPNIFTAVRDIERLRQILGVLVKHGFGEVVARTPLAGLVSTKGTGTTLSLAERLRMIATELGPSFIKLGQVLSTRADLLPADVIRELKVLQDRVPPIAFEELRRVVESELGSPIDELFEVFEREPLASASVGQVHRARLKTEYNGVREVVVKVQRPNIRSMIECDLELLHLIASAIERAIPESRVYQPKKLVSEFDRAISAELDFLLEADNALRFLKNFADVPYARFPRVIREFSTRRVLVLEYIEGKKVYDAVAEGFDPEQIARTALAIAIKSIFEDGFFHADPHPGNVLILGTPSAPVIGLIDLGLVGRLTPHLRDKTIDLMVAAIQEDHRGIADALCAMGTLTKKIDRREFEAEVAMLSQKYLGKTLGEIDVGGLIRDLVQGAQKYGIEIPPDFLLVGKALMTLEGVGREIA